MVERGRPRSRAIALAGWGAAWRASSLRSCSAWRRPRERSVSDPRHYRARVACGRGGRVVSLAAMFRSPVMVGVGAPSLEDVVAVARDGAAVELSAGRARGDRRQPRRDRRAGLRRRAALRRLDRASARWPRCTSRSTKRIELQRGLIRSHAAGSGEEVEREVVRALMLLRLSTLATGRTGVRARDRHAPTPRCSPPASRRSCTSTARSAARATSRRSPTARWR